MYFQVLVLIFFKFILEITIKHMNSGEERTVQKNILLPNCNKKHIDVISCACMHFFRLLFIKGKPIYLSQRRCNSEEQQISV